MLQELLLLKLNHHFDVLLLPFLALLLLLLLLLRQSFFFGIALLVPLETKQMLLTVKCVRQRNLWLFLLQKWTWMKRLLSLMTMMTRQSRAHHHVKQLPLVQ
jgi:hypothetical protein